jgi:hypothetical protein
VETAALWTALCSAINKSPLALHGNHHDQWVRNRGANLAASFLPRISGSNSYLKVKENPFNVNRKYIIIHNTGPYSYLEVTACLMKHYVHYRHETIPLLAPPLRQMGQFRILSFEILNFVGLLYWWTTVCKTCCIIAGSRVTQSAMWLAMA